jgi:hypothetical protein
MVSRSFAVLSCFASVLLAESSAHAETIAVDPAGVSRVASDGVTPYECSERFGVPGCVVDASFRGVGFQDCSDDTTLVIPLSIAGLPDPTVSFQIWAGVGDCTTAGATGNAATATCWVVTPALTPSPSMVVSIRVADLVGFVGVAPPNLPQAYVNQPASQACVNPGAAAESTVNVFFMFFANGSSGSAPTSTATYPVKVKLQGPAPCDDVAAAPLSAAVLLTWQPPPGDPTVAGFDLFAAPGTCGDASSLNPSNVSVRVAGATAMQGTIGALTDGTSYATAVAAVDEFGNTGAPSSSLCVTPNTITKPVVGCACDAVGRHSDGLAGAGGLALLALVARRRSTLGGATSTPTD